MTTIAAAPAAPVETPALTPTVDIDVVEFPHTGPIRPGPYSGVVIVRIVGNIVVKTREHLKQLILDQMHGGRQRFVLDFEECGYIDASGLGMLVSVTKEARRHGGRLVCAELNENLMALIELTRLNEVLSIAVMVIDAIAVLDGALT